MERERINPPTLFQHPAFTRVLTVKGPCKFIFIAGLTAADMNYKCVAPGDCRAQYINILENLTVQLEAAGATWDDVVFRRIYALDVDAFLKVQAEVATPWKSGQRSPKYFDRCDPIVVSRFRARNRLDGSRRVLIRTRTAAKRAPHRRWTTAADQG